MPGRQRASSHMPTANRATNAAAAARPAEAADAGPSAAEPSAAAGAHWQLRERARDGAAS
jgi:hypothetical protein